MHTSRGARGEGPGIPSAHWREDSVLQGYEASGRSSVPLPPVGPGGPELRAASGQGLCSGHRVGRIPASAPCHSPQGDCGRRGAGVSSHGDAVITWAHSQKFPKKLLSMVTLGFGHAFSFAFSVTRISTPQTPARRLLPSTRPALLGQQTRAQTQSHLTFRWFPRLPPHPTVCP